MASLNDEADVDTMTAELGASPAGSSPAAPFAAVVGSGGVPVHHGTSVVVEVLAAEMRYEREMIDIDTNVETELSVEPMKHVEIVSDVHCELHVEAQDGAALSRTPAVCEADVDAMTAELGALPAGSSVAAPVAAVVGSGGAPSAPVAVVVVGSIAKAEAPSIFGLDRLERVVEVEIKRDGAVGVLNS